MDLHFALLDLGSVNIHKKLVLQKILEFVYSRKEILQIYTIQFKFSQSLLV